jgi:hypothetical protein
LAQETCWHRTHYHFAFGHSNLLNIQAGFKIAFKYAAATPMLLMINVHPERERDLLTPERLCLNPQVPFDPYIDGFGNRCIRLVAPAGIFTFSRSFVIRDVGIEEPLPSNEPQAAVNDLPPELLFYLLVSRYCDTDRLATQV